MKLAIVIAVVLFHVPSTQSLAQYHPPLCFKHPVTPLLKLSDNHRPLRPVLGPSMTLWTQISEAAHVATCRCAYLCIVAPMFYSGFWATTLVVNKIDSMLGHSSTYVAPAIYLGYRSVILLCVSSIMWSPF